MPDKKITSIRSSSEMNKKNGSYQEKEHVYGTPSSEYYTVYRREIDRKSGSASAFAARNFVRVVSVSLIFGVLFSVLSLFLFLASEGILSLGLKKLANRLPGSEVTETNSVFDLVHKQSGGENEVPYDEVYSDVQLEAEERLGVLFSSVSNSSAELYRLPLGIVVERISEGKSVFASGIREGDVITQVNDQTVYTVEDFVSEISNISQDEYEEGITLSVYRDGANFSIMCFRSASEAAASKIAGIYSYE